MANPGLNAQRRRSTFIAECLSYFEIPPSTLKSKIVTAVLAWFLGWVGGHRFYLGQTGKGILSLIFFWTFIPAIIAVFDTIIFLVMDEHKFNLKYNREYVNGMNGMGQPTIIINNGQPQQQAYAQPNPQQSRQQEYQQRQQQQQARRPEQQTQGFATMPTKDRFEQEGDRQYRDYHIRDAIAPYHKSLELRKHNPKVHFKLACLYSLEEEVDTSLFHLQKAIMQGYDDMQRIETHEHLSYVRAQQDFLDFKDNGYRVVEKPAPATHDTLQLDGDLLDQLERLGKMKEAGLLTEGEFAAQKQRLLG